MTKVELTPEQEEKNWYRKNYIYKSCRGYPSQENFKRRLRHFPIMYNPEKAARIERGEVAP